MCRELRNLFLVTLLVLVPTTAGAQARLEHSIFGAGATFVDEHTGAAIRGTLGQALSGRVTNDDGMSANGFWYMWGKGLTVTAVAPEVPASYLTRLYANVPNPFNPRTVITFELACAGNVRMELFDVRGRRVDTLIDASMDAGRHEFVFQPRSLASGVYIYRLVTRDDEIARRMVLVR